MTARILDGKALSQKLRPEFALRADALARAGVRPGLAVVLVGEAPASQIYVRNKVEACAQAGIRSEKHLCPADVPPQRVFDKIAELNADPRIHGVLVQLPLPEAFDPDAIIDAIAPEKDVDGFRPENAGALLQGKPRFVPCTPYGIMKFFESENIDVAGKDAVVVGRSNIVGKPTALLLMHAGATVSVCHSKTRDLASYCR
ncbi:MAG: bifunctional methylenetetrahydrofolate dehydrogenase/methenyltetrahydrofolate cyclohydrolase, partial [Candidatus Accumulibacter sp.]|nr:bifunctional methylenetetrahydrofolate dehydrogenase/methenyltetrahydrofolate cyclohydrolase [Accumulibacter sp.]